MNMKKNHIKMSLLALIISPLAATFGLIGANFILIPVLAIAFVWVMYARKAKLPDKASLAYLPIFIAFCYYMCVWIISFKLSGYSYGKDIFSSVFLLLTLPYGIMNFALAFVGDYKMFPLYKYRRNGGFNAVHCRNTTYC